MSFYKNWEKVRLLLTKAVTEICQNELNYQDGFTIEGLFGITLDAEEVFLVKINEWIKSDIADPSQIATNSISSSETDMREGILANDMTQMHPFPAGGDYEGKSSTMVG